MSKPLDRLTLLETFVRIADAGSISAAARDLGLSQPSASRQLAELEARLKTQLIRRNTHSLALTEAGVALLADARSMLDSWEALEETHLSGQGEIRGTLKVVAPIGLGQLQLARLAWRFQLEHPQVSLNWLLDDEPIRFSELGCDCWIKVGPVPDDTLIVKPLGRVERLLVGSAEFAALHRLPGTPKAVEKRSLVALAPFEGGTIPLTGPKGARANIEPPLRLSSNNIVAVKEAVAMGLGMAVLPRWFIHDELEHGTFVDVLPKWRAPSLTIYVAYLPGRHQPRRLRAFLEYVVAQVPGIPGIQRCVARATGDNSASETCDSRRGP
ncbi:MAG: LysR family transcriptional regulator [Xanthomonadales bacterium]|nr:LysR family transcriptional regulator [Xanthomonadales bacterium]